MAITKINTPELLDINTTGAKQLPSGTTAQRPTTGLTAGDFRYNTDDDRVEYYDGTSPYDAAKWFQINDEALPSPVPVGSEHFNVNTYSGTGATQEIDAKFNEAADFNGSSSYIDLGNNVFNSLTSYTVSAWVKVSSTKNNQAIFSNWGYNGSTERGWIVGVLNGTQVRVFNYGSGGTQTFLSTASAISLNTWTNISITNTQSEVKIYINGSLDSTHSTNGFLIDASHPMSSQIGAYKYSGGIFGYFEGSIDQVRIYDSALDQAAVTALQLETTTTASSLSFPSGETATATYQLDGNGDDVSGTYSATSTTDIGYTGMKFAPDFVWIKQRSSPVRDNVLHDIIRGSNKVLYSNLSSKQDTLNATYFTSFDSNGFTLGGDAYYNGGSLDYVAWCWRAAGFANAFNVLENGTVTTSSSAATAGVTAGSITTGWNVSANRDAGFSIVQGTTSGGLNTVNSFGHGLDVKPDLIIIKDATNSGNLASNWYVYESGLGAGKFLYLNDSSAAPSSIYVWGNTEPTSSVFSITDGQTVNVGATFIAYCFHSVDGYSKIGSYQGDRPNTVTVYTTDDGTSTGANGFEPSFLMIKDSTTSGEDWIIVDNKREGTSAPTKVLYPNTSGIEDSYTVINFTSDGFTVGNTGLANTSGATIIYLAIA